MRTGEMERLKEFGLKASSKDNPAEVEKKLQAMYSGGAGKLADSASGQLSTIIGKLKSGLADVGLQILEPLKPVMADIIPFIDTLTPKISQFGSAISSGLAAGINWIKEQMPTIGPIFQSIFSSIGSIVQSVIPVVAQVIRSLSPVFIGLLNVARSVFQGIAGVVKVAAPIVCSLLRAMKPVFQTVGRALTTMGNVFKTIFNGIKTAVSGCWNFIKPILDKIGQGVNVVKGVAAALGGGGERSGQYASGTRYSRGGLNLVGENGPELVQMPSGSKVYTAQQTRTLANSSANSNLQRDKNVNITVNVPKLAEQIIVKEDADIDNIANKLARKLQENLMNYVTV